VKIGGKPIAGDYRLVPTLLPEISFAAARRRSSSMVTVQADVQLTLGVKGVPSSALFATTRSNLSAYSRPCSRCGRGTKGERRAAK